MFVTAVYEAPGPRPARASTPWFAGTLSRRDRRGQLGADLIPAGT